MNRPNTAPRSALIPDWEATSDAWEQPDEPSILAILCIAVVLFAVVFIWIVGFVEVLKWIF